MNRRRILKASAGFAVLGLPLPLLAPASTAATLLHAIRGSLSAEEFGVRPGAADNQGRAFSAMLERASTENLPVFLPPGIYVISDVTLPARVRLVGVPGTTRLALGGGKFLRGEAMEHLSLAGLVLDGAEAELRGDAKALLDVRGVQHLAIDDCAIVNSGSSAVYLERASGRIERTEISHAADVGVYSIDAAGLRVADNTVSNCGNGGILVHRQRKAPDGTLVTGNRIARIAAANGGTGQHGNGINIFRADDVMITGNHVSDSAFSAIRSNSASNVQITGNQCLYSGETAIYSEFTFEGAVINSNIVDGAAHGISIVNFNEGGRLAICSGNLIRNLSLTGPYETDAPGFGVGIAVEADSTVTGNVIENAPLYGMQIGWGPFLRNVMVTGNIIRKTGMGIAVSVVEGSGSTMITDNIIEAAERGAIVGHRWAEPVTPDLALQEDSGFRHLTLARNRAS